MIDELLFEILTKDGNTCKIYTSGRVVGVEDGIFVTNHFPRLKGAAEQSEREKIAKEIEALAPEILNRPEHMTHWRRTVARCVRNPVASKLARTDMGPRRKRGA